MHIFINYSKNIFKYDLFLYLLGLSIPWPAEDMRFRERIDGWILYYIILLFTFFTLQMQYLHHS